MPTTFSGLFLFSLALSLAATFTTLGVLKLGRLRRSAAPSTPANDPPALP